MHPAPQMNEILIALGIFYVILTGIGILCYLIPAKKINGLFGYRTTRSMQDQASWDFAQHIFPRYVLIAAHVQTGFSLLLFFGLSPYISQNLQMMFHIILFCAALLLPIPLVERRLRHFQKPQSRSVA